MSATTDFGARCLAAPQDPFEDPFAEARARRRKRLAGGRLTFEQIDALKPFERQQAENASIDLTKHMATPGALNLPPLLEQRRLEYGLPDHLFDAQATFGFVLVYQITRLASETYGDSVIVRTQQNMDREAKEAPRGIIISAGLDALDKLRSNGVDLGHIVLFSRSIPYRASMGIAGLKEQYLLVLQVGDIFASEDAAEAILDRGAKVAISTDETTQFDYHYYQGTDGKLWKPHAPLKTARV